MMTLPLELMILHSHWNGMHTSLHLTAHSVCCSGENWDNVRSNIAGRAIRVEREEKGEFGVGENYKERENAGVKKRVKRLL